MLTTCSQDSRVYTIDKKKITSSWYIHQQLIQRITQYKIHGTLSLFSHNHKIHVFFYWQQFSPHHYRLIFTNILGITELQLNQENQVVRIIYRKVQYVVSEQYVEEMIYHLTGINISLESFRQWIMGLPSNSSDIRLDKENRLREIHFIHKGKPLHIFYLKYKKELGVSFMPSRIEVYQGHELLKIHID
ncbi:lipoprotein insertase outer membrane protein LolB [Candidatus Erwinia haradaeae]|uniref:lipoprotein insertase outer membrane protein LolB n=1 Tax=Candidatus Erwinia haradaeae TaxID=1922217 RepID=UPI0013008F13|nr:lipoprotein insertase outer membrane protein LolB [Candidatus Erwinia haradaeae]